MKKNGILTLLFAFIPGAGHKLLTGSGFSLNKNGDIKNSNLGSLLAGIIQRAGGGADDGIKLVASAHALALA